MSLARKIAGNAAIQLIARISGNIIGVVVVALLTRYLGQEGFGNYSTIFAYLFFFDRWLVWDFILLLFLSLIKRMSMCIRFILMSILPFYFSIDAACFGLDHSLGISISVDR